MRWSEIFVKPLRSWLLFFHRPPFPGRSKRVKIKDNRMLPEISVRTAAMADLDAILAIERASFGRYAYDRNLFADFTHTCGDLFLVAEAGHAIRGYSVTRICDSARAELVSIAVDPEHQRQGIAGALVSRTLRRLRRLGLRRITLTVKISNQGARSFYEKLGFRKLRRAPRYYEDGSDGLCFVKLL
jgi:ribosomal protein S18 acetylase RimI-like enzyme